MAKNYIQPGETITVAAPENVSSGDPVLVGVIFGVASFDALQNANVEIHTCGVWDLPKATGTGTGWSQGALLYYDPDTKKVQDSSDTNTVIIGVALTTAGDSDAICRVRLNGAFGV